MDCQMVTSEKDEDRSQLSDEGNEKLERSMEHTNKSKPHGKDLFSIYDVGGKPNEEDDDELKDNKSKWRIKTLSKIASKILRSSNSCKSTFETMCSSSQTISSLNNRHANTFLNINLNIFINLFLFFWEWGFGVVQIFDNF